MSDEVEKPNYAKRTLQYIGFYWATIFVVVWPFISLIVFLLGTEKKFKTLYITMVMVGFWVTECIPLCVTGLFPIFMFPMMDVINTKDICNQYINAPNGMMMAGLIIAIAIEACGLHNRIALSTIMKLGCSPRRLHFGLTVISCLLSMWLVNSACTAMMCPIINAVLAELEQNGVLTINKPKDPKKPDDPPRPTNITLCYYCGVAYASTIGGIGCLVGTGTNLAYKGFYEDRFTEGNTIDFVPWLLFNFPGMLLMVLLSWLSLQILLMGMFRPKSAEYAIVKSGNEQKEIVYNVIEKKYKELGPCTWHEKWVAAMFGLAIVLWIFKAPQFIPGWADLLVQKAKNISDASPAFLVVVLLILLPATSECYYFCSKDPDKHPKKVSNALLPWKTINDELPWGMLFLLGGGFSLAYGSKMSGLSTYVGEKLRVFSSLPPFAVMIITSGMASLATELTSNIAICAIFAGVLNEMSVSLEVHPMYFTYPAAICCSFSFMLPAGTPPNAIIAGKANISTAELMKAGAITKLVTWGILVLLFPSYGKLFFDLDVNPPWSRPKNMTATKC